MTSRPRWRNRTVRCDHPRTRPGRRGLGCTPAHAGLMGHWDVSGTGSPAAPGLQAADDLPDGHDGAIRYSRQQTVKIPPTSGSPTPTPHGSRRPAAERARNCPPRRRSARDGATTGTQRCQGTAVSEVRHLTSKHHPGTSPKSQALAEFEWNPACTSSAPRASLPFPRLALWPAPLIASTHRNVDAPQEQEAAGRQRPTLLAADGVSHRYWDCPQTPSTASSRPDRTALTNSV